MRIASAARIREMAAPRRPLALVCFLHPTWRDTLDQAVDMYGTLLARHRTRVDDHLDDRLNAHRHAVDRIGHRDHRLGAVRLDPDLGDAEVRTRVLSIVPETQVREDQSVLANWTRGDRQARVAQTAARHAWLRQVAAPCLSRMTCVDEHAAGVSPTLSAGRLSRAHRAAGRRGVPPDAPLDFAPTALQPLIRHTGETDRRRWARAVFLTVHDEIQTGTLAIDGAKHVGRFEAFFLPRAQWEPVRNAVWARTGFPGDPAPAGEHLTPRLSDAFDRFLQGVPDNRQVVFDDDGWQLKTDPAAHPTPAHADSLVDLHRWLDTRSRSIRLADLRIEVENDLGCSVHCQRPGRGSTPGTCARCAPRSLPTAAISACTPWSRSPPPAPTGGSRTSALGAASRRTRAPRAPALSMASPASTPRASGATARRQPATGTASPCRTRGCSAPSSTRVNDVALECYSCVADHDAPFSSRPIECTARDAPVVLDGVRSHERDLDLDAHDTDTHGDTEINVAAFALVGLRVCPRMRRLHRQRISCADPARDHGVLEPVLPRGRRAVHVRLIAEQWDRFYAATRELGRALKTECVLAVHVRAATARHGAAGAAQGRAAPRLGARRLLRAAGPHQRARGLRPGDRVRVSDPDPRLHRLLAGPGDLTAGRGGGLPVRPRPAASCQPDRVEERHPLRRNHD